MRILIADDSTPIRLSLARMLAKWGHEVVQASDGAEAWALLERDPVPLVISDWMMPEMDGLELCRRVRDIDHVRYIYFILLTARAEKEDLIEGMQAGADDFVVKPFNRSELRVRIRAAERILTLQDELAARNDKLSTAYQTIRRDLESAARVQRDLLPDNAAGLPGIDCKWLFLPCAYVAGDIFDFFALDGEHVGFYLLDVAGHGISSALLSVSLSRVLKPDRQQFSVTLDANGVVSPADVVERLNARFLAHGDALDYFTMVYGVINMRTGRVRLCQAGHPSPLLVAHGAEPRFVGEGGFPVAMLPDMQFEESEFDMALGDRLYLYSDGVTECSDRDDEGFGAGRMAAQLTGQPGAPTTDTLRALADELTRWHGSDEFDDDVSLLALQVTERWQPT